MEDHPYLGTHLSPAQYYRRHAMSYHNPHADGIATVLEILAKRLHGRVLDLGCGDGLITKLLQGRGLIFVGVDNAPAMVARYTKETGFDGLVAGFTDTLPAADCVVASYALHLADGATAPLMWWRLWETGARSVLVITPFKERPTTHPPYFNLVESVSGPYGPDRKTIYGRVYERVEQAA